MVYGVYHLQATPLFEQRTAALDSDLRERKTMNFEGHFTDKEIIRQLCKERVKLARQRHDRMFLHNISSQRLPPSLGKPSHWEDDVPLEIFPPRRLWHRFRPAANLRCGSSVDINEAALLKAVMTLRKKTPHATWAKNLQLVVEDIRKRATGTASFSFNEPTILEEEKEPGTNVFRPLAGVSLKDKIIDRQTARYLRGALDDFLHPSCLAFRCARKQRPAPTIHDALETLMAFRSTLGSKTLYVAECDIRGFFDCVPHALAQSSVEALVAQHDSERAEKVDKRAVEIFLAYLAAYSFKRNVREGAEKALKAKNPRAKFKWPEAELLDLHGSAGLEKIGVPQGGALSCLIANAALHSVDAEIERLMRQFSGKLLYLRYCDDMILVASERSICEEALGAYCERVENLGLLIHQRKEVGSYSKEFYSGKSHHPYPWGPGKEEMPWIQFVGYQIRHDGLVRVRLRSLKKQRRRMTEIADQVLATLNPGRKRKGEITALSKSVRRSARQIEHRLRQRFISLSVGRRQLGQPSGVIMPMCWCNGFRGLLGRQVISGSFKMLDRHRNRQIARVVRRLNSLHLPKGDSRDELEVLRYYGTPFSYWGQFH